MTPVTATGDPIFIKSVNGYGVEPCPGCGGQLKPGQGRVTVPGIWRVWHVECFTGGG